MTNILFILGVFAAIFALCLPFFLIKAVLESRKAATFEKRLIDLYQKLGIPTDSPLKVSSVNLNNALCIRADSGEVLAIDLQNPEQATRYTLDEIHNAEIKLNGTTRISLNHHLDRNSLRRLEKNIKQVDDGQILDLCLSLKNRDTYAIPVYTSKTLGFDLKHQLMTAFVVIAKISELKNQQAALYTEKEVGEPA